MLEWSPYIHFLEKRKKKGKSAPALDNQPELFEDLQPVWEAFNALHRQRQIGMVPEPLSVIDISTWLDMNNYAGEEKREMYELITILDDCWLSHMRKKLKREEKGKRRRGR